MSLFGVCSRRFPFSDISWEWVTANRKSDIVQTWLTGRNQPIAVVLIFLPSLKFPPMGVIHYIHFRTFFEYLTLLSCFIQITIKINKQQEFFFAVLLFWRCCYFFLVLRAFCFVRAMTWIKHSQSFCYFLGLPYGPLQMLLLWQQRRTQWLILEPLTLLSWYRLPNHTNLQTCLQVCHLMAPFPHQVFVKVNAKLYLVMWHTNQRPGSCAFVEGVLWGHWRGGME